MFSSSSNSSNSSNFTETWQVLAIFKLEKGSLRGCHLFQKFSQWLTEVGQNHASKTFVFVISDPGLMSQDEMFSV